MGGSSTGLTTTGGDGAGVGDRGIDRAEGLGAGSEVDGLPTGVGGGGEAVWLGDDTSSGEGAAALAEQAPASRPASRTGSRRGGGSRCHGSRSDVQVPVEVASSSRRMVTLAVAPPGGR